MIIPPEMLQYGQDPSVRSGKHGVFKLRLAHDPRTKKTVAKEKYSEIPLFAQKAIYLEESLPGMAYMYIISTSGGILQGDSYEVDITLEKGAQAHLSTQGATRIYKMENGFAMQAVNISVGKNCYLEYMPDQIIPFRNSRFYQKTVINAPSSATVVYSEVIVPGRVASGESFQYDVCYFRIEAHDAGRIRFSDAALLEPKKRDMKAQGVMEGFDVVGTAYVILAPKYVNELKEKISLVLKDSKDLYGGATVLPYNSGVVVRTLAKSAASVRSAIYDVASITRRVVLDVPFTPMRKG